MRRFLNLAVEELLVEDNRKEETLTPPSPSPPATATAKSAAPAVGVAPPVTPVREAGPTGDAARAVVMAVGVDVSPSLSFGDAATTAVAAATPMSVDAPATSAAGEDLPSSSLRKPSSATKPPASGDANTGTGTDADAAGDHRSVGDSERKKRPAYLGPEAPALMLASKLVSSVHPEVLEAAMSAAVAAADDVARRSAVAAAAAAPRAPGRVTGDHTGVIDGGGGYLPSDAGGRRQEKEGAGGRKDDEDVEMGDVVGGGEGGERIKEAGVGAAAAVVVARGGGPEAGGAVDGESGVKVERQAARAGAARAAVLSVAGLQARGLAELEERRTAALVSDLVEAR